MAIDANDIIESWTSDFLRDVNREKRSLGIKHKRTQDPKNARKKFKKENGDITNIGILMSKGDIMTHKGKGRFPQNRKPKPWFTPILDRDIEELADKVAQQTGLFIQSHIKID